MVKTILFLFISVGFILVERKNLTKPREHGFYRFFSFETVSALFLVNVDKWFIDPFSIQHIFSWIFLLASIAVIYSGFTYLKKAGKAEGGFENTTELVSGGIYRFIRHPMYASLLFMGWGAFLKSVHLLSTILMVLTTIFVTATAKVEEGENIEKFGEPYKEYMETTRMFIPFIF